MNVYRRKSSPIGKVRNLSGEWSRYVGSLYKRIPASLVVPFAVCLTYQTYSDTVDCCPLSGQYGMFVWWSSMIVQMPFKRLVLKRCGPWFKEVLQGHKLAWHKIKHYQGIVLN